MGVDALIEWGSMECRSQHWAELRVKGNGVIKNKWLSSIWGGSAATDFTLPACALAAPYLLLGQVHVNLRTTRTEANTRAGGLGCSPERSRGTNEGGFEGDACTKVLTYNLKMRMAFRSERCTRVSE